MNNWHSVEKGEKAAAKEKSRRILGLLSSGEGRSFLAKGVAKMYGRQAVEKRRFGDVFSKSDAKYFCLRKLFWDTPVYHVCTASSRPFLSKEASAAYATHRKRE